MLLARERAGETWRTLGLAGPAYQRVAREILDRRADWLADAGKSDMERPLFFVPYLTHSDAALAVLAYLEVARAPYAQIRELNGTVPREEIYKVLRNLAYIEWHPLYLLMLGTSSDPKDAAFMRRRLDSAARFDLASNLSAYATAYVEMAGEAALAFLEETFLSGHNRDRTVVAEIVRALSVHGAEGRTELRDRIVGLYRELLDRRPYLAGIVATSIAGWDVTALAPRMAEILSGTDLDEPSRLAVAGYLSSIAIDAVLPAA